MQEANKPAIPNLTTAALPAEPILLGAAVLPSINGLPPVPAVFRFGIFDPARKRN
jgi:hypothetical protein